MKRYYVGSHENYQIMDYCPGKVSLEDQVYEFAHKNIESCKRVKIIPLDKNGQRIDAAMRWLNIDY